MYVPLSGLTLVAGSKSRYLLATRSYQLSIQGRTLLDLPLDLPTLLKPQPVPEYPNVIAK